MRQVRGASAGRHAFEDGFTLIELVVVVIIIGILAAVALPIYLSLQHGTKQGGGSNHTACIVNVTDNTCR